MRFSILTAIIYIVLALTSFEVQAGQNPVGWSLDKSFPSVVIVQRNYSVTYTFTSHLPFTMTKPLVIDKIATPSSDFTYTDQCTGQKLAPNASCTVSISLTPSAAGNESVQLVIAGYDNNRVPVPALTSVAQGQGSGDVYGTVTKFLPQSLYVGVSGNFAFSFTNNTSATINNVSLSVTGNGGGTVADSTQNCGSTLGAGQSCRITGTYVPKTSSPTTQGVSATLNYGSGKFASVSTSTTVKAGAGVVASFIGFEYLPGIEAPTASNTVGVLFTNTGTASSPTGSATITTATTPPTFKQIAIASNIASGVDFVCTNPISVVQDRLKKSKDPVRISAFHMFKKIVREEGVATLYKDGAVGLIMSFPKKALPLALSSWMISMWNKPTIPTVTDKEQNLNLKPK